MNTLIMSWDRRTRIRDPLRLGNSLFREGLRIAVPQIAPQLGCLDKHLAHDAQEGQDEHRLPLESKMVTG